MQPFDFFEADLREEVQSESDQDDLDFVFHEKLPPAASHSEDDSSDDGVSPSGFPINGNIYMGF